MSILFVYTNPLCSCTRKRVFQITPRLRSIIPTSHVHHVRLTAQHIEENEIIVFQRIGANGIVLTSEQHKDIFDMIEKYRESKIFVYDIDDLLFYDQGGTPIKFMRHCDAVWTTTKPLLEYARSFNPNVYIQQNFVDDSTFNLARKVPRYDNRMKVIWASSGAMGSGIVMRMIQELGPDLDQFEFHFFGDHQKMEEVHREFLSEHVVFHSFVSMEDLYGHIKSADLIINPLEVSDKFEKLLGWRCKFPLPDFVNCKSELKYMKAGLAKIPLVTTPTPPFTDIIKHGRNGFLAEDHDWARIMVELAKSPNLRNRVGQVAHSDVVANWTVGVAAKKYAAVIRKMKGDLGKNLVRAMVKQPNRVQPISAPIPLAQKSTRQFKKVMVKRTGKLLEVMALVPVLRELRKKLSAEYLIFVATSFRDVFKGNPDVSGVIPVLTSQIGFDQVYDLDGVCERMAEEHLVDAFSQVLLGHVVSDKSMSLYPSYQDTAHVRDTIQKMDLSSKNYVVLHMITAPRNRAWSKVNWISLINGLITRGVKVVIVGDGTDESFSKNGFVFDLKGRLTVQQIAVLIENSRCFVSTDSDFVQVAGTTSTPIVAIFSAFLVEKRVPYRQGSLGSNMLIMTPDIECYGCQNKQPYPTFLPCPSSREFKCMDYIGVESVLEAVLDYVNIPQV